MNSATKPWLALASCELRRLHGEPPLRWVLLLAPLLIVMLFASTLQADAGLAHERAAFSQAERARWLGQGFKDPHSAAHFGVWAVKPASPLATLMPGVEPFVGLAVWLEAHQRNEMIFRPRQEADPVMRSAASVAQFLAVLGPLLAIVLGFVGFARERERGTLRMALGNGAAGTRLLVLRFAVMALVLGAAMVIPCAILGSYALSALPGAGWEGGYRLLLWCALHLLYLLMFLLLAMSVSLRAAGSRAALAMLLALWLLLCVVLPRAASGAAACLSPVPSYQAVRNAASLAAPAYESAGKWEARAKALEQASRSGPLLNARAARLDQSERESHAVFDRLLGGFYDAVERQDRSFALLGVFTPAVALDAAGTSLAGTDFHHHRHFIESAEVYRRAMVNRLNGELMGHAEHADAGAATGARFWASVPAFAYRPPSLADALGQALAPLLLMLGWCAAAFWFAWRSVLAVAP